jgi:hypothetical protein
LKNQIKIPRKNPRHIHRKPLSTEEIEKLFKTAKSALDRAIIATTFYSGVTPSELLNIKSTDVDMGVSPHVLRHTFAERFRGYHRSERCKRCGSEMPFGTACLHGLLCWECWHQCLLFPRDGQHVIDTNAPRWWEKGWIVFFDHQEFYIFEHNMLRPVVRGSDEEIEIIASLLKQT